MPKLKAAKTAIVTLLKAAKKNNFMLLSLDNCPEIYCIEKVCPEITKFAAYIHKKRLQHKMQYQSEKHE